MFKKMMSKMIPAVKAAAAKKSGSASPSSAVGRGMSGKVVAMAKGAAKKSGSASPSSAVPPKAADMKGMAKKIASRARPFADGGMAKKGASKSKKDCK